MAAKTTTITLAGEEYTVHAFTIGELEEIGDVLADAKATLGIGISILKIAMRRAEPKTDFSSMEGVTIPELSAATNALLKLAGVDAAPNPPLAALPVA